MDDEDQLMKQELVEDALDKVGGGDAFAATKRLAKERQDLISTGAYNATHPIIQAIDTKLQQLGQPIRDGSA